MAAREPYGPLETVRRELREWTYGDAERILSWGEQQEVRVKSCFPALLRWVRAWWVSQDAPDTTPRVLAH